MSEAVAATPSITPPPPAFLTREGKIWFLVTLLLIVTGIMKGVNLLLLLSYLMMGLWIVNWLAARKMGRYLSVDRDWRTPVNAGERTDWRVVLSNGSADTLRGFQVEDAAAAKKLFWTVDRLPGDGRVYLRDEMIFPDRGVFTLGHVRVVTRYPFGLVQKTVDVPGGRVIVVLPRMGRVAGERMQQWLVRANRGDGRTRRRKPYLGQAQGDIHGLRPFRRGDSPRWIDWKSSARRNELFVREFEQDVPPKLVLIVDAWLPAKADAKTKESFEGLLSLAATICRDWTIEGGAGLRLIVLDAEAAMMEAGIGEDRALPLLDRIARLPGAEKVATLEFSLFSRSNRVADSILVATMRSDCPAAREATAILDRPVATVVWPDKPEWYVPPGA